MSRPRRLVLAALYLASVSIVFFAGLGDPNNDGGIPTIVLTLPWSVIYSKVLAAIISTENYYWPTSVWGNFVQFPLFCGGLNALIIGGVFDKPLTRSFRFLDRYTNTAMLVVASIASGFVLMWPLSLLCDRMH